MGSVWVWGIWEGPGLVWMGCVVFAVVLQWGGRLLEAGHQSSRQSVIVGEVGQCVGVRWRADVDVGSQANLPGKRQSRTIGMRWVAAWGCGGGRAAAWASSGRGPL